MLTPAKAVISCWLCSIVAVAFVVARICIRLALRQYQYRDFKIWLSDALLLAGLGCVVSLSVCITIVFRRNELGKYESPSVEEAQIRFAETFLVDTGLYMPKLSLALSFETMVPKSSPRLKWFLRCITVYLILGCANAAATRALWCGLHPSINWLHPLDCSASASRHLQIVTWVLNILGELLLFIFPFTVLKSLRFTHFQDKLGLALVFSLGLVVIAITSARCVFMIQLVNNVSLAVWSTAESAASVVVAATVAFAPFLRRAVPAIASNLARLKPTWKLRLVRDREPTRLPSHHVHHHHHHHHGSPPDLIPHNNNDDDDDDDDAPMPKPTAVWQQWPVDLDLSSMSVTTTTTGRGSRGGSGGGASSEFYQHHHPGGKQRWTGSTSGGSASTGGRSTWDSRRMVTLVREEQDVAGRAEMVSRGTQTLGRVVVELDLQGLPYGARFSEERGMT